MNNSNVGGIAIAALTVLVLLLAVFGTPFNCSPGISLDMRDRAGPYGFTSNGVVSIDVVQRDTVVIERPVPELKIVHAPARVVYDTLRDTLIQTAPFTANIDTVILRDTVQASFDFPEQRFSILLKRRPDSLVYHTITIEMERIRDPPWYETAGHIGLGAVGGFIVGYFSGNSNR